nr:MAG TPA: hypothetical protein [Caudoviricetes sp.]
MVHQRQRGVLCKAGEHGEKCFPIVCHISALPWSAAPVGAAGAAGGHTVDDVHIIGEFTDIFCRNQHFCTSIMAFFYNNVIPWWNVKIILPF